MDEKNHEKQPILPAKTEHLYTICTTSAQRLWHCSNIPTMLYKCFVLIHSLSAYSVGLTLVTVYDVEKTLIQRLVSVGLVGGAKGHIPTLRQHQTNIGTESEIC